MMYSPVVVFRNDQNRKVDEEEKDFGGGLDG